MGIARIGLIGDIHCEEVRLAAAVAHLERSGVDSICASGDIVDGPGDVDRCLRLLAEHDVLTVAGNHERWLLSGSMRELPHATDLSELSATSRAWVEALPRTRRIETVAGELLLCHGLGDKDMAGVTPDDYGYALETNDALTALIARGERLVLNGHTHWRMVRNIDGLCIVNGGTLLPGWEPGFWRLDLEARQAVWFWVAADGRVDAEAAQNLPLAPP